MPESNGGQKQDYLKDIAPVLMPRRVARNYSGDAQSNELGEDAPTLGRDLEGAAREFGESRAVAVAGGEHLS
jgi:hypothetical protein